MINEPRTDQTVMKQRRPICRRYECLTFARLEVPVGGRMGSPSRPISWALGFVVDGQHELIGVWASDSIEPDYQEMLGDLRFAGLERARFASTVSSMMAGLHGEAADIGAVVVPQAQQLLRLAENQAGKRDRTRLWTVRQLLQSAAGLEGAEQLVRDLAQASEAGRFAELLGVALVAIEGLKPALACGPRTADLVLRSDARVNDLHGAVDRSVRRHGSFEDVGEAVGFVTRALERELGRSSRLETAPLHRGALKPAPLLATVRETTIASP